MTGTDTLTDTVVLVRGLRKRFGDTSTRRQKPMVRIARAAAPMLPGCEVRASTKRMVCGAGGMEAVD